MKNRHDLLRAILLTLASIAAGGISLTIMLFLTAWTSATFQLDLFALTEFTDSSQITRIIYWGLEVLEFSLIAIASSLIPSILLSLFIHEKSLIYALVMGLTIIIAAALLFPELVRVLIPDPWQIYYPISAVILMMGTLLSMFLGVKVKNLLDRLRTRE